MKPKPAKALVLVVRALTLGCMAPWLCASAAGCSVVADLDRFTSVDAGDAGGASDGSNDRDAASDEIDDTERRLGCPSPQTLCVRLTDFTPHVDQAVSVDLVSEGNGLRARAYLTQLDVEAAVDFVMPLAIPETDLPGEGEAHPLHLEVWADADEDGVYEPEVDDGWEVALPAGGNVEFARDSAFVQHDPAPRPIGGDFVMRFEDMEFHMGQMLEVVVVEDATGRTVGLHRTAAVPAPDFEIEIPGIIDGPAVIYRIEFYADANDDKNYDDPPEDHVWVEFGESSADGLEIVFPHGVQFEPLDYQFDFRL